MLKSLRRARGKKAGGQVGHPGTTLQPVEKPDHIVVHQAERCQNCQQPLKAVATQDYEITRKGEPEKGSVISQKSLATFIAEIIESPEKYLRENLGVNKPNS